MTLLKETGLNLACSFLLFSQLHAQEVVDFLPIDFSDSSYTFLKLANAKFDEGKIGESVYYFEKSRSLTVFFPMQEYKYSLALYLNKEHVSAKRVFYEAQKDNLFFYNEKYLAQSPLVDKLVLSDDQYSELKSRCFSDSLCLFKEIQGQLLQLRSRDQNNRSQRSDVVQMDSLNQVEFAKILDAISWPGIQEVGMSGENAAFLIAQHADNNLDFQKKCLELMHAEFLRNNVLHSNYAMIIDRFLVNHGKKQLFGTQVEMNPKTNKYEPKPCLYPDEVAFLRTLFQLPSMDAYLKNFNH